MKQQLPDSSQLCTPRMEQSTSRASRCWTGRPEDGSAATKLARPCSSQSCIPCTWLQHMPSVSAAAHGLQVALLGHPTADLDVRGRQRAARGGLRRGAAATQRQAGAPRCPRSACCPCFALWHALCIATSPPWALCDLGFQTNSLRSCSASALVGAGRPPRCACFADVTARQVQHCLPCGTIAADTPSPQTAAQVTDLHRHFIDDITIPSARSGEPPLRRVDEVFDCWFESGSMPYAQMHYPFENREFFEANFPADFVAEGACMLPVMSHTPCTRTWQACPQTAGARAAARSAPRCTAPTAARALCLPAC